MMVERVRRVEQMGHCWAETKKECRIAAREAPRGPKNENEKENAPFVFHNARLLLTTTASSHPPVLFPL